MKELLNVKLQLVWFHHGFIINFPFTLYCKRQNKWKNYISWTLWIQWHQTFFLLVSVHFIDYVLWTLWKDKYVLYVKDSNEVTRPTRDKWHVHTYLSLIAKDYEWNHRSAYGGQWSQDFEFTSLPAPYSKCLQVLWRAPCVAWRKFLLCHLVRWRSCQNSTGIYLHMWPMSPIAWCLCESQNSSVNDCFAKAKPRNLLITSNVTVAQVCILYHIVEMYVSRYKPYVRTSR